MSEWIYKEQHPDYVERATGKLPLVYAKNTGNQSPDRSFTVSAHTSKVMSRQITNQEANMGTSRTDQIRFESQIHEREDGYKRPEIESDEDEEEAHDRVVDLDSFLKQKMAEPKNAGKLGRTSVSAEVIGKHNKKEFFKPRFILKDKSVREQIKKKLTEIFLFKFLEEKDLEICIDAMEIRNFARGDVVIRQGEEGNELFVVESGTLDCSKNVAGRSSPQYLLTYRSGMAFGE